MPLPEPDMRLSPHPALHFLGNFWQFCDRLHFEDQVGDAINRMGTGFSHDFLPRANNLYFTAESPAPILDIHSCIS